MNRETIVRAMARLFWLESWVSHVEEHGCYKLSPGADEHAPETPDDVQVFAERVASEIEKASGVGLLVLYTKACTAILNAGGRINAPGSIKPLPRCSPERFGECLAFQYMGSGVRWEDDHPAVPGLVIPHGEGLYWFLDNTCQKPGKPGNEYDSELVELRSQP